MGKKGLYTEYTFISGAQRLEISYGRLQQSQGTPYFQSDVSHMVLHGGTLPRGYFAGFMILPVRSRSLLKFRPSLEQNPDSASQCCICIDDDFDD